MTNPEPLDLTSHNIPADKTAELLRLFPEIRTEGEQIDFDKLKLVLGGTIDVGREHYGMTWPGKAECFKTIQSPSMGTLLPVPDESVEFDTTENLIIEGDNLEVLKLLQKAYLGKVKMIYIDPPYNTGNDFIYPDNYTESLQTYLEYTGQVDAEGRKFGTNSDTDGRFHSRWMNMMYPRLYLARNLLRDDGVIFISIDDNEVDNLRKICSDVFGEENFIADIAVVNNLKGRNDKRYIARANERLLMFVKSDEFEESGLRLPEERLSEFEEEDNIGKYRLLGLRKRGGADTRELRPKMFFAIYVNPDDGSVSVEKTAKHHIEVWPRKSDGSDGCWRWGFTTVQSRTISLIGRAVGNEGRYDVFEKDYLETDGEIRRIKPKSVMAGTDYSTDGATKSFRELMPDMDFSNPKSVPFLRDLVSYSTNASEEDLVLDFFAGSGTTAHAVFELNKFDDGNRRFILIQLPEPTEEKAFQTIAEITKERVRRVIKKLNDAEAGQLPMGEKQDRGFRVFKLAESNFKTWDASASKDGKALEKQLELHIEHIRDGRTSEDILYEILLKSGFALTTPVEKIEVAGKSAYSVANGGMLICLEKELTLEVIRAIAEMKPQRVICLDLGFAGNDQLKTNAVQIFKNKEIVFKTV